MLCERPKVGAYGNEFSCSRCVPCRINKQRTWTTRLLLEAGMHAHSCFVTLTYAKDPGELVPRDLKLFLRKVWRKFPGARFYAVGEYGGRYGRPHYHLILFGVSWAEEKALEECWEHGFIHVGDVTPASIRYVTDYLLTKNTHAGNIREDGRYPEFARMSRKGGGIGSTAVSGLVSSITTSTGEVLLKDGDVPCTIRQEGKEFPMGNYLLRKFRTALGRDAAVPRETGLLRTLQKSAESVEVREKRRRSQAHASATHVTNNLERKKL